MNLVLLVIPVLQDYTAKGFTIPALEKGNLANLVTANILARMGWAVASLGNVFTFNKNKIIIVYGMAYIENYYL